ncbi:MAG: pyruvate ferredoxin oxidoreductase [Actinobacteria bacterium]|nr:pyruvate ferredoxin oxidoreductase [Actinomycetota bacterium]
MKVLETGNHLVALAVRAAGVEVVPAYPITPQTQVVEMIADLIAQGKMEAEYIPVESEHSACAALIAASLTGVRAFSATSSHGLAYMHEMLHFAAGLRTPVVMVNVNRSLGPGWNIWCDQQDSISARDTGWMQVYVSSHQETVDTVIQAFKIAEDHDVLLPIMVNLDAFVISHTYMDAIVPEPEEVSEFLPSYRPLWALDTRLPVTHGSVVYPSEFSETRQSMQQSQMKAIRVIKESAELFKEKFGRWHGDMVDTYRLDDAEYVIVSMGSLAAESMISVDTMRDEGIKAGLLRVRFFRPFPVYELQELCRGRKSILVIDRNYSYGLAGVLFTELKSALYGLQETPIRNLIVGLGGRDVPHRLIAEKAMEAFEGKLGEITWGDTRITEAHVVTRELLEQFQELYK